jgi:hypothetical protein
MPAWSCSSSRRLRSLHSSHGMLRNTKEGRAELMLEGSRAFSQPITA